MAFYRFQLQSHLDTQAVLERIRALVRQRPGFGESLKESIGFRSGDNPPFIGTVEGDHFRLYRDIRYRNSFLPRIRGRVSSAPGGTNIDVIMYLHPLVLLFMLFWLTGIGFGVVSTLRDAKGASALVPLGMFAFGVALTLGGFYPEAFKARRILERQIATEFYGKG